MSLSADDAARVWAWAAALSAGEPVTWAEFRGRDAGPTAGPTAGPVAGPVTGSGPSSVRGSVPGAAQLEVLRRLAVLHADRALPGYGDLAAAFAVLTPVAVRLGYAEA